GGYPLMGQSPSLIFVPKRRRDGSTPGKRRWKACAWRLDCDRTRNFSKTGFLTRIKLRTLKQMAASHDEFIPTRHSLLQRLKNWEDQSSWRDFFDTYWKLIYSFARRAGLSEQEAQ